MENIITNSEFISIFIFDEEYLEEDYLEKNRSRALRKSKERAKANKYREMNASLTDDIRELGKYKYRDLRGCYARHDCWDYDLDVLIKEKTSKREALRREDKILDALSIKRTTLRSTISTLFPLTRIISVKILRMSQAFSGQSLLL